MVVNVKKEILIFDLAEKIILILLVVGAFLAKSFWEFPRAETRLGFFILIIFALFVFYYAYQQKLKKIDSLIS